MIDPNDRFRPSSLVAIIGMACRFPKAPGLQAFWRLLESGESAVSEGEPGSGIGRAGTLFPDPVEPRACRFGAYLDDLEKFDAAFFRIAPVEARLMDPQQRLMLETCWHAMEDAALSPDQLRGSQTGVFAGISNHEYRSLVLGATDSSEPAESLYSVTGTSFNTAIGRIAFAFGFEGPAVAVDTACSSSLVAIHQAVSALERHEADLALAGGTHAILSGQSLKMRANAGMLSPDGRCATFDAAANGHVRGEGCGIIVLKRLEEAVRDGDRIWGLIRGSAVNHDGASAGLTVPSGPAQERVIASALRKARLEPAEVDYVEAHGTGTAVGDPIELRALGAAYGIGRDAGRPLLVGSVKTNIGHLEPAAGVASVIKVILAMQRGMIPRHLNFQNPNPNVDWERLRMRVAASSTSWPAIPGRPMRAGVSGFGWSGTNAHIILESPEAPNSQSAQIPDCCGVDAERAIQAPSKRAVRLLPLSAKSGDSLRALAQRYLAWLDENSETRDSNLPADDARLSDMAWTAGMGRAHFEYRAGLAFGSESELRAKLRKQAESSPDQEVAAPPKVAFLFAGQGSQWPGMGEAFYRSEPVVREVLDRCEEVFRQNRGASLLEVMFGRGGGDLHAGDWAHPALYALECAHAALWASIGVTPDVVVGHSTGELAAAQVAGVFDLEAGMQMATKRSAILTQLARPGAMAAIFAPGTSVEEAIDAHNQRAGCEKLCIAGYNGAHQVISGEERAVDGVAQHFQSRGVRVSRIRTSHAFHSPLVEPALDALEHLTQDMDIRPPARTLISNVTGKVVRSDELLDGVYWRNHARQAVAFDQGVQTLADLKIDLAVEVGPHAVLGPMLTMAWPGPTGHDARSGSPAVLTSSVRPSAEEAEPAPGLPFMEAVGAAYEAGVDLSFEGLFSGESRQRISIPGYPFQGERHWVDAGRGRRGPSGHPLLGARRESADGTVFFETELRAADPAWLKDHQVFGRIVAPGSLFGVMAWTAGCQGEPGIVDVEEMQFHSVLAYSEARAAQLGHGRTVQLLPGEAEDGHGQRMRVFSKGKKDQEWTLHAECRVRRRRDSQTSEGIALDTLTAGMESMDAGAFYRHRLATGIEFSGAFLSLKRIWVRPGEAVAEVWLDRQLPSNDRIPVHPVLLDGCFQALGVARWADRIEETATYVPFGWERLWISGRFTDRLISHAQLREAQAVRSKAGEPSRELVVADIRIYNPEGVLVGGVDGFMVKRATRSALLGASSAFSDLLYEEAWVEDAPRRARIAGSEPNVMSEDPGVWVLAADRSGFAEALGRALIARNQTVILAEHTAGVGDPSSHRSDTQTRVGLDHMRRESWIALLEDVPDGIPIRGVVNLSAIDGCGTQAESDAMASDVKRVTTTTLALTQALIETDVAPASGVWIVTRGAATLKGTPGGVLAGAVLWGLGRVAMREAERLRTRLLDLDFDRLPQPSALAASLLNPDRETQIAYRGDRRYCARLVRAGTDGGSLTSPSAEPRQLSPTPGEKTHVRQVASGTVRTLRSDRTYLVTGGLGGIGSALAAWLFERGAGTVALNGRRTPSREASQAIDRLRGRGYDVRVEIADVSDCGAVDGMLARMDERLPPLGGVIHSVGVLSNASLANQTWASFEKVLWPKVLGAWHLHRRTVNRDLDLFILFSSAANIKGNPGQANHAAANAFLDRLAAHRRALGLAGQTIAWGAWSGIGEAEERRRRIEESLASHGSGWITPEQGFLALDHLLRTGLTSSVVANVDWSAFGASLNHRPPVFESLLPRKATRAAAPSAQAGHLIDQLRASSEEEREEVISSFLQREVRAVLKLSDTPARSAGFFDLGMDSLTAIELRNRLSRAFADHYLPPVTLVFDYPDIATLARRLAAELGGVVTRKTRAKQPPRFRRTTVSEASDPIAVVGMACRFPGAADLDGFWTLLREGRHAVTNGRPDAGPWTGVFGDPGNGQALVRHGGFVEGIDRFDADFFGVRAIEAMTMDPRQRMLLESCWEALDDAGIDPESLRDTRTGVYVGMGRSEYREVAAASGSVSGFLGVNSSVAVGRVAYALGLMGPAITVDAACASSLVTVHQAAASLRQGEVNLALAGGVHASLSCEGTRSLSAYGLIAPGGVCRTFDAGAEGFVRGEGCGIVVLKRLRDAEADGDRIWGLIRGSAVNQSGTAAGLTTPNGNALEQVIELALDQAGVQPSEVDFLEAHGAASLLGDPIEVHAASNAYDRDRERPLLMGAVKTNIGHLEAAAGVASLIKVMLALRHRTIPGSLHYDRPNPHVDWDLLPVRVITEASDWPWKSDRAPLAAVSAFAISGTNAHMVVEGYGAPEGAAAGEPVQRLFAGASASVPVRYPPWITTLAPTDLVRLRRTRLLPLSGKSPQAIRDLANRYLDWLHVREEVYQSDPESEASLLADMAWSASVGRSHFNRRATAVFGDVASLRAQLTSIAEQETPAPALDIVASGVAFVFPGACGRGRGVERDLYESEPVARAVWEACDEAFRANGGPSLLDAMVESEQGADNPAWKIPQAYAAECAIASMWASLGIRPRIVIGMNIGAIAAAHVAGALELSAGMRLAMRVGQAIRAPDSALSGTEMMRELQKETLETPLSVLKTPLVLGGTGDMMKPGAKLDANYWREVARKPGLAARVTGALAQTEADFAILMGPGAARDANLDSLRQAVAEEPGIDHGSAEVVALAGFKASEQSDPDGVDGFMDAVAATYRAGLKLDLAGLYAGERRRRIAIPGYPFQRQSYWFAPSRSLKRSV